VAEDREGFVARWSRLKRAPGERDAARPAAPEHVAAGDAPQSQPAAPPPAEIADLPPIDSLNKESDFTAFMTAGVPEALKNQALRKLWRSDPVFANLDGLLEYGEDFNAAWKIPGGVKTLYQIGRGMVDKIEESAEAPADSDATATSDVAGAADAQAPDEAADPAEPDPVEPS